MTPADRVREIIKSIEDSDTLDDAIFTDDIPILEACAAAWEREQVLQLGLNWKEHYNNDQQK